MGTKRNKIDTEMEGGSNIKDNTYNERRESCIERFDKEERRASEKKKNVSPFGQKKKYSFTKRSLKNSRSSCLNFRSM